mmetsp:Transcript_27842/g.56990  ORF Transcript_27842/g.56990 Transcript_27842/m.56990 type:complete len:220 (-) Transcript_27842:403-1062(-)|eukprot:CAMPEP_0181326638 /NCGR_PEP_ID=MMETSP1101-20121128/21624_1 /TAXON_ID=46948 /ORGANISM="Rhodomonas abbreviata, Strain Caron Lab Isolate" /LENGTH=219 /DNA_ID=CAMNT_0023435143 /DNA_START=208 /DNA_END=867 /DNA_ORIENTATION=-
MTLRTYLLLAIAACFVAGITSSSDDDEYEDDIRAIDDSNGFADVQGTFPNPKFLSVHKGKVLKVLLDGGKWQTPVRIDGSFTLYDVPEGSHLLEVAAPGWVFEQIQVDVVRKGKTTKVKAYYNSDLLGGKAVHYPLRLEAAGIAKYFEEREKFNPLNYLKNPMVMMMLFVAIMAFVMPKMINNMDPEELERAKESYNGGLLGAATGGGYEGNRRNVKDD